MPINVSVGGVGSGEGSSFLINDNHFFADNNARDNYFTSNPSEKITGVLIGNGTGYEQWNGSAWADKTAVVRGPAGTSVVDSVAGRTGAVVLTSSDVGLGNVDNTADADKPVSTAQQLALDDKSDSADEGVADGIATLDSNAKLTASQIPESITGGLNFLGTWNADTNTPTLTNGSGSNGDYYKVSTAGTTSIDGISSWAVGDWILSNSTAWEKIDQTETVTSVSGRTGAVTLTSADVSLDNVTNDAQLKIASNLSDLNDDAAARTNLGLGDMATKANVQADDVDSQSAFDGQVLTANGAGGASWVNQTGGSASSSQDTIGNEGTDYSANSLSGWSDAEANVYQY